MYLLLTALSFTACGGSEEPAEGQASLEVAEEPAPAEEPPEVEAAPPPVDLAGSWTGPFSNVLAECKGSQTYEIKQKGSRISGRITQVGHGKECAKAPERFTGTIDGKIVELVYADSTVIAKLRLDDESKTMTGTGKKGGEKTFRLRLYRY